jgi:ELWxxDGT repeat protein
MSLWRLRHLLLILPMLGLSPLADNPARLVRDINRMREPPSGGIGEVVELDGVLYFVGYGEADGSQIWRTDGSEPGTRIVENLGRNSGFTPYCLTPHQGEIYFFRAWGGLWKTNGLPAGTVLIKEFSTLQSCPAVLRGELFFGADDGGDHGTELWKTDGTAAGTVEVTDLVAGPEGSHPFHLMPTESALLFHTYEFGQSAARWALWKTDGTASGTLRLHDYVGSYFEGPQPLVIPFGPAPPAALGGIVFFLANDGLSGLELWRTDGTAAGTQVVRDINPGPGGAFASPDTPTVVGGSLYFSARDGVHGFELWKSDGTAVGTTLVSDVRPGPESSYPAEIGTAGGTVYFGADDGTVGRELWRSDGTAAGTRLVADLVENSSYSYGPGRLTELQGTLYFLLDDVAHGRELWESDGTAAGTALVRDFLPGRESSLPYPLVRYGGALFFGAHDEDGFALWKIDAPGQDPWRVRSIASSNGSARPSSLVSAGGSLCFRATDGKAPQYGTPTIGVWASDGTVASTRRLTRAKVRVTTPLVSVGETVYFGASDPFRGNELWKSDGTSAGTAVVKDILPGRRDSSPQSLTGVGNLLFFSAWSGDGGLQLWRTDGTGIGTVSLGPTHPDRDYGAGFGRAIAFRGQLYFVAADELWKSDGTAEGTARVRRLETSIHLRPVAAGDVLYLAAGGGLWRSDGSEAGTVLVKDFGAPITEVSAVGGDVYLAVGGDYYQDPRSELWKSNGTAEGTARVRDFTAVAGRTLPKQLTAFRGTVVFVMTDAERGEELWRSDGSESGTVLVKDVHVGVLGSEIEALADVSNTLVFGANDGSHGRELWRSDGTAGGTFRVADISPGAHSSNPRSFTAIGPLLFFSADDGLSGEELWALPLSALQSDLDVASGDLTP